MRLRSILIVSYVFMAVLAGLLGVIGIQVTQTIHREFEFVRNDLLPVSAVLEDLRRAGMTISSSAADFGLVALARSDTEHGVEIPRKKLVGASQSFVEALLRYEKMVQTLFPEEEQFLTDVRLQGGNLQAATLGLMDVIRAGATGAELLEAFHHLQERESQFLISIEKALDHEKWELVESKDEVNEIIHNGLDSGVAATILVIVVALGTGIALAAWLTRPLVELKVVAERFGQGQLGIRAAIRRNDEIGALAQAFNKMADALELSNGRLLAGKKYLDDVIRSVPDGLLVTDRQNRIMHANPAAQQLLNQPDTALLGRPLLPVLKEAASLKTVGDGGVSTRVELEIPLSEPGAVRLVSVASTPLESAGERDASSLVILRDITAERQIERMKTQFISTAAHELSTPLTSILGYANLLHDDAAFGEFSDAQKKTFIAEVHDNAEYLFELTNKLLDLDRMETGQAIPLNLAAVNLATLVEKAVHRYRRLFPDYPIETVGLEHVPGDCCCDPVRITQVLENLISNAIKYSPSGKPIRIDLASDDEGMRIEVTDQGRGMTKEEQARAFEPFYRADDSDTAPRGTGLGLCIVKNIVKTHGGRVWIDSTRGRGSRVGFVLPGR
jgi:PAS domain S-box-containing protein